MTRVAVATTSAVAADAAREVSAAGGNAVDCAVATAILSMNTEPGVCSFAGGAYVTIWAAGDEPLSIDGIHAVPGLGLRDEERGHGAVPVELDYGGGMTTIVGCGSVAVPGALAAFDRAWRRYGTASWEALFGPAIRVTREGFPLSASCHYYLGYCGKKIYGRSEDGFYALHNRDGSVRARGSRIIVPHLADSLAMIAEGGADVFYRGELATKIVEHVREGRGALTAEDLARYEAIERPALVANLDDWQVATNPAPAVGGAVLAAMLIAYGNPGNRQWSPAALDRLVRVHRACLDYRRERLDISDDVNAEAAALIAAATDGRLLSDWVSGSTVHTSAVDDNGLACSITASAGYGAGEMPEGTGLWLNNGLGEVELNRRDVASRSVGSRLPSNMAPTVARNRDSVLAIGSPGADRITSAIHQVLVNALQLGMPLDDAIAHPRLHVDMSGEQDQLTIETGLAVPETDLPVRQFDGINMYFGGVCATSFNAQAGFIAAADPRRESGTHISNA